MIRRAIVVVLAVVAALGAALTLYARSVLASDQVRATLESQLAARLGRPVSIGEAGASIFPRIALELREIAVGDPPSLTLGRASISTGLRGLFSRRIEDAEVLLAGGRMSLPEALAIGTAAGGGLPPDAEGAAITIASVRTISLQDIEVVAADTTMRIGMESSLAGDRLEVSRLSAVSERTTLEATGALDSVEERRGALTVRARELDVDELIAFASGITTPAERADAEGPVDGGSMRIALDLEAASGSLAGHAFSDLRAQMEAVPSRIRMDPLALRTSGGTFEGTLQAVTTPAPPAVTLRGTLAGLDVAALAGAAGKPGAIAGSLGGTVALQARGAGPEALAGSARGSAAAAISDGAIPGLEMVRAIVLAFGKPSGAPPEGSGSAFTRLGGDFVVANGGLRTENLTFASRDFDMRGRAALVVATGALDAEVDVVLSEELTAQAGTDLRRYAQSAGRIILPARIGGTLSEPAISLDLEAASRRALENELKRRAKSLLEDLLRRKKG